MAMPTIRAIRSSTTNGQWDRGRALKKRARRLKNVWRTGNNLFIYHAEVGEEEEDDGSVATTTLGLIFWRHRSMDIQVTFKNPFTAIFSFASLGVDF